MASRLTAGQVLDRYFLEMRCKVLDVAAALDRLDRAPGADKAGTDSRIQKLREAIPLLLDDAPDRAGRLQMIFSDPYDAAWKRPHQMDSSSRGF